MQLSILIPTYNTPCLTLVQTLQQQCQENIPGKYEIIVADDASTNQTTKRLNNQIPNIPHCKILQNKHNQGRAQIRNQLAQTAKYQWLLFIDADMNITQHNYIQNYIQTIKNILCCAKKPLNDQTTKRPLATRLPQARNHLPPVIYGGYQLLPPNHHSLRTLHSKETTKPLNHQPHRSLLRSYEHASRENPPNLRYIYEQHTQKKHNLKWRKKHPYTALKACNTIIHKNIFTQIQFDNKLKQYGYEDLQFAQQLQQHNITVIHIHNTLTFQHYDTNQTFLQKTQQSIQQLAKIQLNNSQLQKTATILKKYHLHTIITTIYNKYQHTIIQQLIQKPNYKLFQFYKLAYYLTIKQPNH